MKLFVAKLNRDAVESDLLEWFGVMGPVKSVKVVTDRDTGQSKCFGFVGELLSSLWSICLFSFST